MNQEEEEHCSSVGKDKFPTIFVISIGSITRNSAVKTIHSVLKVCFNSAGVISMHTDLCDVKKIKIMSKYLSFNVR